MTSGGSRPPYPDRLFPDADRKSDVLVVIVIQRQTQGYAGHRRHGEKQNATLIAITGTGSHRWQNGGLCAGNGRGRKRVAQFVHFSTDGAGRMRGVDLLFGGAVTAAGRAAAAATVTMPALMINSPDG